MEFLLKKIEQVLRLQKRWKTWQKIVAALACFTVAVTTYALILPAITLNQETANEKGGIVLEETEDISQEEAASGNEMQAGAEQTENTETGSPEATVDGSLETAADAGQNASEEAAVLTGIVYPESLNVRAEKSKDADVLETVFQGTSVTILEDQGDGWLFVSTPDGQNGYVKAAYVLLPGETVEEKKPAMTFEMVADKDSPDAEISEAYINGTYSKPITVHVEAPVGAFPAGTTMKVRPIAEEQVREAVESVIPESETVNRVSAVDITFIDVCGDEIEPDTGIKVSLTSEDIPSDQESVVVHVDNEGQAEMVEAKTEEENIVFESDKFSVYVIVRTKPIGTTVLTADGETYTVTVSYTEEANLPADVSLKVEEITNKEEYEGYKSQVEEEILDPESKKVTAARFFDITLLDSEDNELHPEKAVTVVIETKDTLKENEELQVCHFDQEQEKPVIVKSQEIINETYEEDNLGVQFEAETFYVYGIVRTKPIGTTVLTADGETYTVTVSYTEEANLPADVSLKVEEITNKDEYEGYKSQVEEEIFDSESKKVTAARFFDITLMDIEGNELHPEKAVTVVIETKDTWKENEEVQVCHFDQEKDKPVIVESQEITNKTYKEDNLGVQFEAESFSVYGIVGTELVKDITLPGSDDIYEVTVTYGPDANIPDGSRLEVTGFDVTSDEYKEVYCRIFGEEPGINPEMMALDISIIDPNGNNVEPEAPVQVSLKVKELPENISSTELKKNIVISHLKEMDGSIHVEQVATGSEVMIDEQITTEFVVESFSTFTINWNNWNGLQVSVVDTNGNSVGSNSTISIGNPEQVNIAPIITGYDFVKATIGSRNGTEIKRLRRSGNNWQYSTSDSEEIWNNVGNNRVYFVYERTDWVKVYVYVAAKDTSVTPNLEWKNNPEFLELLGISGDTVDGNGYFPVGEILLPSSFFNGKTTNKWDALIKSSADWEAVLNALGVLDSSTLIYDLGIDYSQNRNNNVGEYLDKAIGDVDKRAGSQCTALFGWSGHSYGFADQTVQYHLDLRFQPNRVTFITGNNNNPPGLRDGTTVDVRAYIQGSPIQQPRNLVIPAGYRLVGYYNDPDFTTPWDKIGTPIMQDEIAYIKITPQENVILYYKPVPAGGGTVSLDAEGLNPETGTPAGSTATPNPGYEFVGWYADEECTQLLSTNATYVPTKNSGERWVDGTTYYAKFQEEAVTLRFIAEDHIHHVELVTDAGEVISVTGNNTKDMSVTINKILGPAVTVRGVAENGYVVKEWTINGGTGALTTSDEIETAITDDPNATSGKWTDRTYHVWAESPKSVKVKKQVEVVGTVKEQDVDLYVYFALKKKGENDFLMKDGHIWTEKIQIVDGIPQEEFVQFDGLQSGTYEVWEVADENASSLRPGNIVITTDSGGRAIIAANIRTIHGDSTSNNVTVSDTQPTDGLTVINTYSHENETMEFTAKKQWYSVPNTVNQDDKADASPPAGAWASFTIYKKDSEDPIRTIRLDGTPDDDGEISPWTAVFDGIPRVDDTGNEIHYEVRETSFSEELNGNYYYAYKSSVENSGGSIKNAVLFGNINVYKQIEVRPRNDEMNALVAAVVGNLQIHVTGPHEYDETFTFTNVTDPYNPSLQITGLPAGEYTLEEVGYEDLLTGRKWNPTLSWIKAGNSDEQSGKTSVTFEVATNGASNDSVDVRLKNDYTKYDIKATKVWDDQGMVGLDHPSVPITLYRIDAEGNKTSVSTKIVPANAVGEYLTVVWENQEQQDQEYTYEIVEGAVDGYEQISITGDMFNGFTVTNKAAAQLRIVKTDQSGNALEGAVFTFSGGSINETGLVSSIPQGGTEAVVYENRSLPMGTYILSETDPPAGYNALTSDVTITAAVENGQVVINATMNGGAIAYLKLSLENGIWTLQIADDQGMVLPTTGGPGALPYTLGGLMLFIASALMYGFRMRRRERRLN